MSLEERFESALSDAKELPRSLAPDELLELYSLFKQATLGNVVGTRPGLMDFRGRAKYDAWAGRKGVDREVAMQLYVDVVERLQAKYR